MHFTLFSAVFLHGLASVATAAEQTRPLPKKHLPSANSTLPHYKIPQDTYADLIAAPGAPSVGQPKMTVDLFSQIKRNRKTNQTSTTQHLVLHAGSFIGGTYESLELYIGCRPPVKGAASPKGKSGKQGTKESNGGKETAQTTSNNSTTASNDTLSYNFTPNCHKGHNSLDVRCEVPLQHLARYKGKNTGCVAKGDERAFECGQKLDIAVHARVTKAGRAGTKIESFDLWARGTCLSTRDKKTSRKDPACDDTGDMAQYFEVEATCDERSNN